MIRFTSRTPKICDIYNYTYSNKQTYSRFLNCDRDILKTKIKIERRFIYRKSSNGINQPTENLIIHSESCPQYYPYNKVKTKGAKKQRKIHHQYDCFFAFSKDEDGNYSFWNSQVIFHIGSYKKYPKEIPQSKTATIHKSTRERLERKYKKLPQKQKDEMIKKEILRIKKHASYICDSDYIGGELHINGDFYFRCNPLLLKFDASYGKVYYSEAPDGILYPFFPKHAIACINFLLRKGIIKYK